MHQCRRYAFGDGRICISNNAAERSIRCVAVGRKNWTFAGSDEGGRLAAVMYTLIETCKLNDVDARAWLADVLGRIAGHPARQLDALLPWNWKNVATATVESATQAAAQSRRTNAMTLTIDLRIRVNRFARGLGRMRTTL